MAVAVRQVRWATVVAVIALIAIVGIAAVGVISAIGRATAPDPWDAEDAVDGPPAPGEISVLTLLSEMSDLAPLARKANPPFVAGQAASTDRRSRSPAAGESWFANDDFVTDTQANLVRVDRAPDGTPIYVLLDVAGPGAIVRIWSATPTGTLRIFVDENPQPALEASMVDLLSGHVRPFTDPFGYVAARGANLYFPFPFRKRCLVTVDSIKSADPFSGAPMSKLYYQIGYRRYAAADASKVRPFAIEEVSRARATRRQVATALRDSVPTPVAADQATTRSFDVLRVSAGAPWTTTVEASAGGGEITELRFTTAERNPELLRTTWLTISFDDEPAVRAPLMQFFGTDGAWASFATLPLTISERGTLICRWHMPFRRQAAITVERHAPGTIELGARIGVRRTPFSDDTLLFHAKWRPRASLPTRPFRDWHLVTIEGDGQYVGTVLNIDNPPNAAWWGEGDEKIFVDGESFPSLFGTGTEDYFGYAWSTPATFARPYHAQTRAAPSGFTGAFSMNRFHVLDPIPFRRSLRFDLEIWHWSDTTIAADAVMYWYARAGGRDDVPDETHVDTHGDSHGRLPTPSR